MILPYTSRIPERAMNLQIERNIPAEIKKPPLAELNQRADQAGAVLHEPLALSLDERGMIKDCSRSLASLLGYRRSELVWKHVSKLFSQLKDVELYQNGQVNPMLNYLSRCGQTYEAQNRQGNSISTRLNFVCIDNQGKRTLRLIVHT
jgi:PAS domain S-box-containing protein